MERSLRYVTVSRIFSIIRVTCVLCLILSFQQISGQCLHESKRIYYAEDFGFMVIDYKGMKVEIFKNITSDDSLSNIGSCIIKDITNGYFTISSIQPISYKDIHVLATPDHDVSSDSISVRIRVPESEAESIFVLVSPYKGHVHKYDFSTDGTVEFSLKKYDFEIDNYFNILLFHKPQPFQLTTSWGDSETLSFLDLRLDETVVSTDSTISGWDIYIPDFTKDIFLKWVILDEYVLYSDQNIIWRNILFRRYENLSSGL